MAIQVSLLYGFETFDGIANPYARVRGQIWYFHDAVESRHDRSGGCKPPYKVVIRIGRCIRGNIRIVGGGSVKMVRSLGLLDQYGRYCYSTGEKSFHDDDG